MINWDVRWNSKTFWMLFIPAVLVFIQVVAKLFGYELDFTVLEVNLIDVVNAAFALLAVLGVVVDPTTVGIADSKQAKTYSAPKDDDADPKTYLKEG